MLSFLLQFCLFCWFILSIYLVWVDPTLSRKLKIIGEIINVSSLVYISLNAFGFNQNMFSFILGCVLLIWFIYYLPQDIINPGYTSTERAVYVTVDICMIIYLTFSIYVALIHKEIAHFSIMRQVNCIINDFCWI